MFTQIKTSKINKEKISILTRKLNLGTENIIARIAYTYSLSENKRLNLETDLLDSGGKEYSKNTLFGEYFDIYIGLVCLHYNISKNDEDLSKYIKMHIDDGIQKIYYEYNDSQNIDGISFLLEKTQMP